ncbi:unnamed protein product [Polarella glacialis]|uniref:Uncharacterized protein n=1 Tax=Polarella glacialis TaxID=89957 RepID=A0A813F9I1_POLGL|nr:unnamed protein product [Polarella glacialis]
MSSRGLADYVLVLHGIDEWLATAPGSTLNLADHLDSLGSAGAVAFLESHFLYHLDRNVSGDLVQSGIYRPLEPRQADSRPYNLAPHLVFRPAGATYVDTHYLMLQPRQAVQRRETGTWIRLTEWWVNHYADFMGPLKRMAHASLDNGDFRVVLLKPASEKIRRRRAKVLAAARGLSGGQGQKQTKQAVSAANASRDNPLGIVPTIGAAIRSNGFGRGKRGNQR